MNATAFSNKPINMEKRVIDLGWANGWHGTPTELQNALVEGGKFVETYHHDCETHYRCELDDRIITYKVDSSD